MPHKPGSAGSIRLRLARRHREEMHKRRKHGHRRAFARKTIHIRLQPPRHSARLGLPVARTGAPPLSMHCRDCHRRQPAYLSVDSPRCQGQQVVHRAALAANARNANEFRTDEPLYALCHQREKRKHLDSTARRPGQRLQRPHPGLDTEDDGHGRQGRCD